MNNLSWARPIGSLKKPVNFGKIAEAFDGFGIRVERPSDIASALKEAFDSSKPAIVDVVCPGQDGFIAMHNSWKWIPNAPTNLYLA